MNSRIMKPSRLWQTLLASGKQLALTILCGLLLVSGALAQEQRPEEPSPEQPTPEAAATQKVPDPNETVTPSPLASQVVDGDLIFTSPGAFTYTRDIRLSDSFGGLRFYGADSLTTQPAGAAIQFFGNNATPFAGQLFLDSGALNSAALIFRTAGTGGTITERMRVTATGNVAIGTTSTSSGRLKVLTGPGSPIDAVVGETSNSSGYGVYGIASGSSGIGVRGVALGSATTAGRFEGNVQVTGTLIKGSGSFKIDHPLDPAHKYLSHSFVESPDMLNIYNGNVTTDAKGRAVVTLPDYFTALNRDYRYQLTVIGQFAQASSQARSRTTASRSRPTSRR